jgi:AcrR family transcriptional regulator
MDDQPAKARAARSARPERDGYHHGSLPSALVSAALELLDERGAEQVSMREVARRVGVSPGAPFRHFADRQALLTAVAGRVLKEFGDSQAAEVEQGEGPALRDFGLGFVRYAMRHPHRFALMKSRVFGAEQPAELASEMSGIDRALTGLIEGGQQAGVLREGDPAVLALACQATVYGLAQMTVDGYLPAERAEQLAGQALEVFGLGIVNPAAGQAD